MMPRITHYVLAVVALLPLGGVTAEESGSPLRIAFILPLSGDAASIGQAVKNGSQLALAGLNPAERARLRIVYEDDQFVPQKTISAYQKIKNNEGLEVAVIVGSNVGNALAPVAEKDGVPLIAMASDPAVVAGRKHVVNFWVTPREEAALAVPEALRRGYKTIARAATTHTFPLAIKRAFDARNAGQIKVVLDEEFQPESRDFRTYLARVKALRQLDAILILLMPGQVGVFAKQAREMGIKADLFNFEFFEDPNEVRLAQGALEGGWYVNAATPGGDFVERYTANFPGAPLFGAANGHDVVMLLIAGLRQQAATRPALSAFLHSARDVRGVFGSFSAAGDNTFTLPAALKVVTRGGFADL